MKNWNAYRHVFAGQNTSESECITIRDRDLPGRLREQYWARRAKSNKNALLRMEFGFNSLRSTIGRESDDPGDEFNFYVQILPGVEHRFEWIEVTEVYTTVPATQINEAMRHLNGIPNRNPFSFDDFLSEIPRGIPTRVEQQRAADSVIKQIEKKLSKHSYDELLEEYGYGTLVVGMPLWFATLPLDPFRAENAIDDFVTRVGMGLKGIKKRKLKRQDCPFKNISVVWDTSPQAISEWIDQRTADYDDVANIKPHKALKKILWDSLNTIRTDSKFAECEIPSLKLNIDISVRKKERRKGQYPATIENIREAFPESSQNSIGYWTMLKMKFAYLCLNLFSFVKVYKIKGLKRWVLRKFSIRHAWRLMILRLKVRWLYNKSIK